MKLQYNFIFSRLNGEDARITALTLLERRELKYYHSTERPFRLGARLAWSHNLAAEMWLKTHGLGNKKEIHVLNIHNKTYTISSIPYIYLLIFESKCCQCFFIYFHNFPNTYCLLSQLRQTIFKKQIGKSN